MTHTQVATEIVVRHTFHLSGVMTVDSYAELMGGSPSNLSGDPVLDDGKIIAVAFSNNRTCSALIRIRTKTFAGTTFSDLGEWSISSKRVGVNYFNDAPIDVSAGNTLAIAVVIVSGQPTPDSPRIDLLIAYPTVLAKTTDLSG